MTAPRLPVGVRVEELQIDPTGVSPQYCIEIAHESVTVASDRVTSSRRLEINRPNNNAEHEVRHLMRRLALELRFRADELDRYADE